MKLCAVYSGDISYTHQKSYAKVFVVTQPKNSEKLKKSRNNIKCPKPWDIRTNRIVVPKTVGSNPISHPHEIGTFE